LGHFQRKRTIGIPQGKKSRKATKTPLLYCKETASIAKKIVWAEGLALAEGKEERRLTSIIPTSPGNPNTRKKKALKKQIQRRT